MSAQRFRVKHGLESIGSSIFRNPEPSIGFTEIGSIKNDQGNEYIRSSIIMTRDQNQITYDSTTDTWTHAGGGSTDFSMIVHRSNGLHFFCGPAQSSSTDYTNAQFNTNFRRLYISTNGDMNFQGGDVSNIDALSATTITASNSISVGNDILISEADFNTGTGTTIQTNAASSFLVYDAADGYVYHKDVSNGFASPAGTASSSVFDGTQVNLLSAVFHQEGHITGADVATLDFDGAVEVTSQGNIDIKADSITADMIQSEAIKTRNLTVMANNLLNPVSSSGTINGWGGVDESTGGSQNYIAYDSTENAIKFDNNLSGSGTRDDSSFSSDTFLVNHDKILRISCEVKGEVANGIFYIGSRAYDTQQNGQVSTGGQSGNINVNRYNVNRVVEGTASTNKYFVNGRSLTTSYQKFVLYFIGANRSLDDVPDAEFPSASGMYPYIKSVDTGEVYWSLRFLLWNQGSTNNSLYVKNITVTEMGSGQIVADNIKAGAITTVKLDAEAVTADKIEAGAITADKIDAGAVTTVKLDAEAVTAAKIDAGAITTVKLDANAVTADKIGSKQITTKHLLVADLSNIITNPSFSTDGESSTTASSEGWIGGWSAVTASNQVSDVSTGAPTPFLGRRNNRDAYWDRVLDVKAGEKFLVTADMNGSQSTQQFGLGFRVFNSSGGTIGWYVNLFDASDYDDWAEANSTITMPTGAHRAQPFFQISATSNFGEWFLTNIRVRRKANAQLIVDGAITTVKLDAEAVTADKIEGGTITGDKISASTTIIAGTESNIAALDGTGTGGGTVRIFAGSTLANKTSAPFRITQDGAVTATSGTVGGWTLSSTAFTGGTGNNTIGLIPGTGLHAGNASFGSSPFRVTNAGALTATNATITGAITATSGSIADSVTIGGGTAGDITTGENTTTGSNVVHNPDMTLHAPDGRPSGVKAVYGSSSPGNISYEDTEETILKLAPANGSDTTIGAGWPAFRVNPDAQYKILIRWKGDVADNNGIYFRMQEYDDELPYGKTHISNNASASESGVQEDTRQITSFYENQAITTSFVEEEFTYTPTSTAIYASPIVLNWSGYDTNELHIDRLTIVPITLDKTRGSVGGWTIDSSAIFTGTKDISGFNDANAITLSSTGTIHAKKFYIDTSGNAFFKGDITGANGAFAGTMSASNINTGTLNAARIGANSITTGKLKVGDLTNLARNNRFENSLEDWGGFGLAGTSESDSVYGSRLKVVAAGSIIDITNSQPYVSVEPGEKFYIQIQTRSDSGVDSGQVQFGFIEYASNKTTVTNYTNTSWNPNTTIGSAWVQKSAVKTTQNDTYYIRPWVSVRDNVASGNVYFTDFILRRQAAGTVIEDGAITTDKIEANAVTATEIAANTITATEIAANVITASEIAANTITASEIAADTITASEIAANAVTASEISTGAVTTDKLTAGVAFPSENLEYHWPMDAFGPGGGFTNAIREVKNGTYDEIEGTGTGTLSTTTDCPTGKGFQKGNNIGIELLSHTEAQTLQGADGFSWAFWVRSTSSTSGSSNRVISRDFSDNWGIQCAQNTSGDQEWRFFESGSVAMGNYPVDKWIHIAFTYPSGALTGQQFKIYVNGDEVATRTYSPSTAERPVGLGCNTEGTINTASSAFVGTYSDIRAYSRELSQAEIRSLYNATGITAEIHGDMLVNGTVTADQLAAGAVTADDITTGTLDASNVTVTNLSADSITSGTLDASNVTVSNLSANSITGDVSEHFNSFFETPLNKRYAFTGGSNAITTTPFSVSAPNGGISKRLYINGWLGISKSTNDQRVIVFVEQKGFTVSSINLGQLVSGSGDVPEDNIRELIYTGDVLGQGAFPGGQISADATFDQSGNNCDVWGYNYDSSSNRTTIWVDGSSDVDFIPNTTNDPHYWHAGPQSSSTWVRVGETIGIGDFSTSSIDPYIVVPVSFVLPAQTTAGQIRVGVVLAPGESTSGYAIRGWNCNFGWLR